MNPRKLISAQTWEPYRAKQVIEDDTEVPVRQKKDAKLKAGLPIALKRIYEKLEPPVEFFLKLHLKHYHMSPKPFGKRTSAINPWKIFQNFDLIGISVKRVSRRERDLHDPNFWFEKWSLRRANIHWSCRSSIRWHLQDDVSYHLWWRNFYDDFFSLRNKTWGWNHRLPLAWIILTFITSTPNTLLEIKVYWVETWGFLKPEGCKVYRPGTSSSMAHGDRNND